ncbi:biotin transporter BioY [Bacillus subtilis]|uniref:biotin transporter BioY n=1 Tax=Bacillus subtilis TaxID=1423 RepID=UPI0009B56419|nr:biotin transporter BioY [Bacillus subtilis]MDF4198516.1 biotin transporter BioY [Bacillus subtilis]MDF4216245.1 biotin transporter BioY [Bacillus subtilis]MEC3619441.1 biotin transporter BioY [Bacillus subtilis]MEC3634620.1 biotin transporter BioY [Bacillus subtilis]MEC3643574.1 biotin transporter BioY [Bacillus subtilis]
MLKLIDMMHIAIFTALMAVLGFMPPLFLSFTPVPITLQTLGVMLAGGILRPKSAFLSQLVFLLLVAFGAPLLPGGRGGFGVFFGPSAGFLIAYPLASWLISLAANRLRKVTVSRLFFTHIVFGIIFIYLLGIPVQAFIMHIDLSQAAFMSLAYVPGDLIKAAVSAFLAIKITQALSLSDTMFTKGG